MDARPSLIFNGRSYPLFQRGSKISTPWSVRVQVKGVRRAISTGTPDLNQAKERALSIVQSALNGDWATFDTFRQPRQPHKPNATIGEVFKASDSLSIASVKHYRSSLVHILKSTGHPNPESLPTDILTAPLARAFQATMQGLKQASPDTPTAANGTANSHLKNARCMFSRKALAHYDRHGLSLPDLRPFMDVPLLVVETDRYSDHPISDAILKQIDLALPSQSKDIRKTHLAIRLKGTPPGKIPKVAAAAHARFLRRWKLTPSHLWHHAAAAMLRRTGSLEVAAQWTGLSLPQAKWHIGEMAGEVPDLTTTETYLGL